MAEKGMIRRGFITGLISFAVTTPAIVRAGSLMPVKLVDLDFDFDAWRLLNEAILKAMIADAEHRAGPSLMAWRNIATGEMVWQ